MQTVNESTLRLGSTKDSEVKIIKEFYNFVLVHGKHCINDETMCYVYTLTLYYRVKPGKYAMLHHDSSLKEDFDVGAEFARLMKFMEQYGTKKSKANIKRAVTLQEDARLYQQMANNAEFFNNIKLL